jgi:beta-glucanase (GH16 family)
MFHYLALFAAAGLLLAAAVGCTQPQIVCPLKGKWEPIPELTDEFDGDKLDTAKWHPNNPEWRGRQPGFFSRDNVTVSGGKLHLTARKEERKNLPPGYHTFTTAAVQSKAKVKYGYFEIRCRPMNSSASSAFWFYCNDAANNWWTEIDMFEIGAGARGHERTVHMNVHVFETPTEGKKHWDKSGVWQAPFNLSDDFHVYALEWNAKEINYYVDGNCVRTIQNTHWHQALTMNFDSETFPDWFGLPKPETLPSTFSVEYVRSWRQVSE